LYQIFRCFFVIEVQSAGLAGGPTRCVSASTAGPGPFPAASPAAAIAFSAPALPICRSYAAPAAAQSTSLGIFAGWSLRTRFLRRSTARGGQARNRTLQLERTRLYVKSRCVFGGALKIHKALNALPPMPGTSTRARKGERDEGGELARLTRSPARALTRAHDTRTLESHMLPTPPQPPTLGRAAGGMRLRARTPRRVLPLGSGVRAFHFTPWIYADSPTEGGRLKQKTQAQKS